MSDWEDPIQRAAVWYVAAFGALSAVLIAGVSLASVDLTEARHPAAAVGAALLAVAAASWVGFGASRVLTPRWTSTLLNARYIEAKEKTTTAATWREVAAKDPRVLSPIVVEDGFDRTDDSPHSLWSKAQQGDETCGARLREMVAAANRRSSRRWYRVLTATTPIALAAILATALAWASLSKPDQRVATISNPIPVRVRLNEGVDPQRIFGPGCTARERDGVAVEGVLPEHALVTLPADDSCPTTTIQIDPATASIIPL